MIIKNLDISLVCTTWSFSEAKVEYESTKDSNFIWELCWLKEHYLSFILLLVSIKSSLVHRLQVLSIKLTHEY